MYARDYVRELDLEAPAAAPVPGRRTVTSGFAPRATPPAPRTSNEPPHVAQGKLAGLLGAAFAPHLASPAEATDGADRLPGPLQAKMEQSFGADFSSVRVHHDGSAEQLGAQAYASGDQLHFAAGAYDPHSDAGQALIGHELAHVVQQRAGRVGGDGLVIDHGLEQEADVDGARAARGESIGRGGGAIAAAATVAQGKLAQASGVKQAFAPAVPPAVAGAWASLVTWCGVEANVTAAGILTSLAGGAAGVIGPIIQPGSSGVQAYTIAPWRSPDAEGRLTMYVQAQFINAAVRAYERMKPSTGTPAPGAPGATPAPGAPGATPAPGGPSAGPAPAPPVVGQPVPDQPASAPLDPTLAEAIKVAVQAEVNADLALKIQNLVKTSVSNPEFVWSDSGSNKPDTLGTVGAIRLNRVRSFRLDENITLDPAALAIPEVKASFLHGKPIRICGIFGGDLVPGPSWKLGFGDNLAVNVQSRDENTDGVVLNTAWQWDNSVTLMSVGVTVASNGEAVVKEVSRSGSPDDNWYLPG